jgi:hypothetical protein
VIGITCSELNDTEFYPHSVFVGVISALSGNLEVPAYSLIAKHGYTVRKIEKNITGYTDNFRYEIQEEEFRALGILKKNSPSTRHGGAWWERRYSSYSFTTSALDGGEWSALRPGRALTPGERTPVPIVQEAGWVPEPVWTQRLEEKSSAPSGDRTPIARSSSP